MKKNAEDSFSGIPAIVLGSNDGSIERNNEETNAIEVAFVFPNPLIKISLTKKKKAMMRKNKNENEVEKLLFEH